MHIIRRELDIRKQEIDNYISFIETIEREQCFDINKMRAIDLTILRTSMKAGIVVMFYNSIESTMTKCLNKIHDVLKRDNLYYDDLNSHIKKIVLIYYQNIFNTCNNVHKIAEFQRDQIELIKGYTSFKISYDELSKYYSMYSGNLDAKQIKLILARYGIEFSISEPALKTIKDYRNSLAHGEKSFEEIGRELTIQRIRSLHNKTFSYMNNVLMKISEYLDNKDYMQLT